MKRKSASLLVSLVVCLMTVANGSAQGGKCTDISLSVTLTDPPSSPAAGIHSDGLGPYVDGQSGISAKIQTCSGYYDAVIQLGATPNTTRQVTYNFSGSTVATNSLTPTWASSGSTFQAKPLFNVDQIADSTLCPSNPACYRPTVDYTFTTFMWNSGIVAPDAQTYILLYVSDFPQSNTGQAYVNTSCDVVNSPSSTSLVQVHHVPATYNNSTGAILTPETWVVTPIVNSGGTVTCANSSPSQSPGVLATLLFRTTTRNTTTTYNAGQFSLPFQMTLARK